MDDLVRKIWEFIRGDLPVKDFEQWVYKTPKLENLFGKSLYFDLLVCNYQKRDETQEIKKALHIAVEAVYLRKCDCVTWRNYQKVPISTNSGWESISKNFSVLVSRTPWLQLARCLSCSQYWYVAIDAVDDDYYLYRLSDENSFEISQKRIWPAIFDQRNIFWPNQEWLKLYGFSSLEEWQLKNNKYPCPACGFLVFEEPVGSYEICPICTWEDDPVQLYFPALRIGANKEGLCSLQKEILSQIPYGIWEYHGFLRDPGWRPLTEEECKQDPNQPADWLDYFYSASKDAPIYYWRRTH